MISHEAWDNPNEGLRDPWEIRLVEKKQTGKKNKKETLILKRGRKSESKGAARKKGTAVCVRLSQDDYSSQVTQVWRALRKTVRNTIVKKTTKSYISRKHISKQHKTLVVSIRFSPMCGIPRNKPR